jgi:flagellar biosynthesis/type III secretory pathway chaperone
MVDRDVEQTKSNIAALRQLLEKEFEALKGQNFDVFEKCIEGKNTILAEISNSGVLERLKGLSIDSGDHSEDSKTLAILHKGLGECRDLHRRNEVLIRQKIIAIRETIASFSLEDNPLSETYDNLGNLKKGLRKRQHNFD